jgi:glycogen operon protein
VQGTHDELTDIAWFTPAGDEMNDGDWHAATAKSLAVFLNGEAISEPDPRGQRITGESFLLLLHAGHEALEFTVPRGLGARWSTVLDTVEESGVPVDPAPVRAGDRLKVPARSLLVLRRG